MQRRHLAPSFYRVSKHLAHSLTALAVLTAIGLADAPLAHAKAAVKQKDKAAPKAAAAKSGKKGAQPAQQAAKAASTKTRAATSVAATPKGKKAPPAASRQAVVLAQRGKKTQDAAPRKLTRAQQLAADKQARQRLEQERLARLAAQEQARKARERMLIQEQQATADVERQSAVRLLSGSAVAQETSSVADVPDVPDEMHALIHQLTDAQTVDTLTDAPETVADGAGAPDISPTPDAADIAYAPQATTHDTPARTPTAGHAPDSLSLVVADIDALLSSTTQRAPQQPAASQAPQPAVQTAQAMPAQPQLQAPTQPAVTMVQTPQGQVMRLAIPPQASPALAQDNLVRVSIPARDAAGRVWDLRTSGLTPVPLSARFAFVMDQSTGQALMNKDADTIVSIASLTKLMTAVVLMDANQPMDEVLAVTDDDVYELNAINRSSSRLPPGTMLTRQEMLHLALMSSDNRAAYVLGRAYPGGLDAFVRAMNTKAATLGMRNTRFVEPTGLSAANQSTARDLAQLVSAAYRYPLIRTYSTFPEAEFPVSGQMLQFRNTNPLVRTAVGWDVGLQKTGTTAAAGRCMVTQANVNGRNVIVVVLDAPKGPYRVQDTDALLQWVQQGASPSPRTLAGGHVIAQTGSER